MLANCKFRPQPVPATEHGQDGQFSESTYAHGAVRLHAIGSPRTIRARTRADAKHDVGVARSHQANGRLTCAVTSRFDVRGRTMPSRLAANQGGSDGTNGHREAERS